MSEVIRMNWTTATLVWLSGHSAKLASKTPPAEQTRLAALGACLILPVGISGFGAFATVFQVFDTIVAAVISAVVVAGFTLVVDRALLASTSKSVVSIGLRVCLTLLSSTIFAHTALLWLFSDAIDRQAAQERRDEIAAISTEFQPERDSVEIETINSQIEAMTERLQGIDQLVQESSAQLSTYRTKYSDEVEGRGPSGTPGEGPEARRLMTVHIEPLEADLERHRLNQVALQDELQQLRAELRKAVEALAEDPATARLELLADEAANQSYDGVLSRFLLLHELIRNDRSALVAYLLICLFLLLWELNPVLLKLTAPDGEYARQVRLAENQAEADGQAKAATMNERAELQERHRLNIELMELEEMEAKKWLALAEERFQTVQEQRSGIPKRATDEQRDAYLEALKVATASLEKAGKRLKNTDA